MKERLIELLMQGEIEADKQDFCNCYVSRDKAECVADFLLANGVIVPPCKVGDVVYLVRRNHIEICEVETIHIALRGYIQVRPFTQAWIGNQKTVCRVAMSSWDKTLFATGKEAETALAKMRGK